MAGSFAGKAENAGYKDLIQHVFNFLPHNQDLKLYKKPFENIVGKGENARNQHFFFPTIFSSLPKDKFKFFSHVILSSANSFNLDLSKILSFGIIGINWPEIDLYAKKN